MGGFLRSISWAMEGIGNALRQRNFRIQLVAAVAATLLGIALELSAIEWAVLALTIGFVLTAEVMNTALESAVDLLAPEPHPAAKRAKDAAAGAVLIASATSVVVGLFLFGPKLLALVAITSPLP